MDFRMLPRPEPSATPNPFAGRRGDEWVAGFTRVEFLQEHFGQYSTAAEMKAATESEGLRRYFDWLAEQGVIPAE